MSKAKSSEYPSDIPPLEWVVAGLGLALLIGFVVLLLHHEVAGPEGPPDVEVKVEAVQAVRGGYRVLFAAYNHGGTTASALLIRGELERDGAVVESREAEIDHLPPASRRGGGMFFRNDPQRARLVLSPTSYQEP